MNKGTEDMWTEDRDHNRPLCRCVLVESHGNDGNGQTVDVKNQSKICQKCIKLGPLAARLNPGGPDRSSELC